MRLSEFARGQFVATTLVVVAALCSRPAVARADEPQLAFDFGQTLECRDVTPPDFADAYADERIIECTLRLSVYLTSGMMSDVDSLRVEISDCDHQLRVHDFSPRTQLESELAGDVEWTTTTELTHELGASLGGELPACIGDVVAHVTPSINATKGKREVTTQKQVRLAPKQVVVVSGTIDREYGVFYILRPSPQTSLEGVHELTVAFIVPATWRGDAVRVTCRASGEQKVLWMKQQKIWAEKSSGVALYLAGDAEARRAAEQRVRQ